MLSSDARGRSQFASPMLAGLPTTLDLAIGRPGKDRLSRFLPALLALTLVAAALEVAAAIAFAQPVLATAALASAVFALGITFAGLLVRNHRAVQGRFVLAATLTLFGAIGAYLVPGLAPSMALLPVLAVVLVLRYVDSFRLIFVVAAGLGSSVMILAVDAAGGVRAAIPAPIGTVFLNAVLVTVVVLVLAGLADFASEARNSLRDLHASTERNLRVTTARLSIVSSLRILHAQATPEATAQSIANALGDLPLVDIAAVLEVSSAGEVAVLAVAGRAKAPVQLGERLPAERAAYILERSRAGAWAELWAARTTATLHEERLTELGLQAQAFAPIVSGDVIVGLIIIGTTDEAEAPHLVADLPSVSEAAGVAGSILAPALMAQRQTQAAKVQITQIIASRAFHPEFQPVVDLHTGRTVGFEALTRFTSGDSPDRVFSDAARAGIESELEAATLSAAVRDAVALPSDAWLSLNVSPTFLGDYAVLAGILADRNRPIILEVTEHVIIDDYSRLHAAMRALGPDVRLAVDDAGAGVANFRHLVDLRPNLVKVDSGMIRGVEADISRQALIVGLVHFAEVSGAQVLAEGIETLAERETVKRLGVTLGQGFLLGRPAPVSSWIQAPLAVGPGRSRLPMAVAAAARPN